MKQHKWHKDEALKMAIESLKRYGDTYGGTDGDFEALNACERALEEEWQGLDLEQQRSLYHKIMAEIPKVNISWWDFKTIYPTIEQKLKEKNK